MTRKGKDYKSKGDLMKYMSEVIYLKNTFFHMFKYVEVVKCIEKTYVSYSVVSDLL